jgi:flagellar biosynthesis chaperone FliJ
MIWVFVKEVLAVMFWPKGSDLLKAGKKQTFDQLMVIAGWTLVAFFLWVSIPHSVEIILLYEHGDWALVKAITMAAAIELIPAFTFMLALHHTSLESAKRYLLMGLAAPLVLLVLHIQYSYYFGTKEIQIWALELAAVLPYGILVGTVAIAFLGSAFQKANAVLTEKIKQAVEAVEAQWREIVEQKEQTLEATRQELEASQAVARNLINAPDPLREALLTDLAATRQALETTKSQLATVSAERDDYYSRLVLARDEREGLEQYIATLEKASALNQQGSDLTEVVSPKGQEDHSGPFPRAEIAEIFRRMNPKVANLKREDALNELEQLWPASRPAPAAPGVTG